MDISIDKVRQYAKDKGMTVGYVLRALEKYERYAKHYGVDCKPFHVIGGK